MLSFNEIEVRGTGGVPAPESWDDDVWRTEMALGRRVAREVLLKLDWQHFGFSSGSDDALDMLAVQLSAVF